ncbi:MAG: endonuclease/exonuclease/phosphatase family protein [Chthoniobacteraceae bacterium]
MKRTFLLFLLAFVAPLAAEERDPAQGIVFCSYNVRNYLGRDQASAERRTKAKPEKEIEALIKVISEISPDVLGVCEMGSPAAFDDFKARLEKAGLGYKDSEYVAADDEDRHLALVSRFPIVHRDSAAKVRFELNGTQQSVKRGFLDVTLQIRPGYRLRCVGVHLKSKLPTPEGEALIRRHEAAKLRGHLDAILGTEPAVNLLCYGDFNDAKNQPMFSEVSGVRGTPGHMADLAARDSHGDRWTHHWPVADEYARIDYLFASRGLLPEVKRGTATVYRSDFWEQASDHRPVFVTIVPIEKSR